MQNLRNTQLRWLSLSFIVIIIDQFSKWLVSHYLILNQPVKILPVFNLIYMRNAGAAFGFLRDAGGWQRLLFILIAVVISGILLHLLYKLPRNDNATACATSLILGGAVGNLYDRAVLGHVTDFASFHLGSWYFATFNIADSAITIGIILWLWIVWRRA